MYRDKLKTISDGINLKMYTEKQENYYQKKKEQFNMQRKLNKELITGSHNLVRARRNILFKVLQYSLAMLRVTEF